MAGGVDWTFDDRAGVGTGGGTDALSALLKALGGGGGLAGLGLTGPGALLGLGGGVASGLAGLLRGKSSSQKSARKTFNLAQNRLGQNVIQPEQYLADFTRAMLPSWNKESAAITKRLGLDSGVAQGALAESRQSSIAEFMFKAKMMNDQLKSQSDNALLALMGNVGRYM